MHQELATRLALSALASAALLVPIVAEAAPADEIANAVKNGEVVDLTVTVAENYRRTGRSIRRSSAGP